MPSVFVRGAARLGPRLIFRTTREQLLFTRRFLGLRCEVAAAPPAATAKVPVHMVSRGEEFRGFLEELRSARGDAWLELITRQRMLEARVSTLYVAVDEKGEPIYGQWLVLCGGLDSLDRFAPGRYPRIAADEAIVEGAYTFLPFRGLGVMADGMSQLIRRAGDYDVRSVVTYVREDNIASLRGCARVGFVLDHLRINKRRLGLRSSLVTEPDDLARSSWHAAVEQ